MHSSQNLTETHNQVVYELEKHLPGVQFLKNFLGQKTAVLIDLKEHSELWTEIEAELEIPLTVQFLTDEQGKYSSVLLDLEEHGEIWEDIYDSLIVNQRVSEPTVSLAEVKLKLLE
jgi:hypothetical protein